MTDAVRAFPVLNAASLDAALARLEAALGLVLSWRQGNRVAAIENNGVMLFLMVDAPPARVIANLADADAAAKRCESAGLAITDPVAMRAWGMREFRTGDADGNTLIAGHEDASAADYRGFSGPALEEDDG